MTNIQISLIENLTSELVMMVHERFGLSLISAMRVVYGSDTFRALSDTETLLYQSSAQELFCILDDERKYGQMVSRP